MPRKKEGLGPAFSCRLHEDQDVALRASAAQTGLPLVTVLRMVLREKTLNRTFEDCLKSLVEGTHGITAPAEANG